MVIVDILCITIMIQSNEGLCAMSDVREGNVRGDITISKGAILLSLQHFDGKVYDINMDKWQFPAILR